MSWFLELRVGRPMAGTVSDVDIESEKYRWMGGLRLTIQVR